MTKSISPKTIQRVASAPPIVNYFKEYAVEWDRVRSELFKILTTSKGMSAGDMVAILDELKMEISLQASAARQRVLAPPVKETPKLPSSVETDVASAG